MRRRSRSRLFWIAVLAASLAVGGGAGALTASIPTWATTSAGIGSVASSGFTIGTPSYTLNASSPQNLDSVTFTISPVAATTVKIKLSGNVYACTGTTTLTCATTSPQATATAADTSDLVVVAAQ